MNSQKQTKCAETASTMILYLYGEAADPKAFEAHLDGCAECRTALESHRRVIAAYRAETVEAPKTAEAPSRESLWDKVRDFFKTPMIRPILAGAAAFAVVLIALVAIRTQMPSIFASRVPSYTDMESRMDSIDDDLDSLFAMNSPNEFAPETDYEPGTHQELSTLDSELNNIQDDFYNF